MPISNRAANSGLSFSVGMIETRLALPQRSPSPLSVPWICRAPARFGRAHAVANRGEIFFQRRLQGDAHVIVPGLGDEADRIGLGLEQRSKPRVVRGGTAWPARHPERGEGRAKLALLGEQLR